MQLLLEEEQYQKLASTASADGRSIGALIREAIDLVWIHGDERRQQAGEVILAAEPMPVPNTDDLRREIYESRFAGHE